VVFTFPNDPEFELVQKEDGKFSPLANPNIILSQFERDEEKTIAPKKKTTTRTPKTTSKERVEDRTKKTTKKAGK